MPNYSLVSNAIFQPFTYQELAAPLDRQDAYHEKLMEEYDKLSSQADVLEAMGENDRDKNSKTYQRYKAYSNALKAEADALYNFGLNSESRQRLSDLRRMYNTDIVPIQNAWTKREQESADQMKARLNNPSLMFTRDAQSTSLEEYVRNPTGGYGVINGANISAQMAAMAKNLEKQVRLHHNRDGIDPLTYEHIEKYGLTPDMIRDWRNNPTLRTMFEQVMSANGVTADSLSQSANMQDIMDKSTGYAEMGMWNAVGEDKSAIHTNLSKQVDAQAAKEVDVYKAKKAIDAEYAGQEAAQQARKNEGSIPLFFDKIVSPNSKVEVNAVELRFGDDNDKVLKHVLPRVLMTDKKTFIKEVKDISKDGKVTSTDKYVDVKDLIDDKGNAKGTPLFYRINSPNGKNSIIMKLGTKSYVIPGEKLGNIFGESNVDVDRLYETNKIKERLINKYGEDVYWSNPESADIENILNNYGASSVRRAGTALAGSYKIPTYELKTTSENKAE